MNELGTTKASITDHAAAAVSSPALGAERRVLRVWMVDDNAALRGSFAQALGAHRWLRVSRQFSSLREVLATLAEERPPHIILLDLNLGAENGLAGILPIKKLAPQVKVVMFTTFTNTHAEAEAYRLGASGFVLKIYELSEIIDLVHKAYYHPADAGLFPNVSRNPRLLANQAAEPTGSDPALAKPSGFLAALRQLYRNRRRQTAH